MDIDLAFQLSKVNASFKLLDIGLVQPKPLFIPGGAFQAWPLRNSGWPLDSALHDNFFRSSC
jgi:hypothetical protein